MSDLQLSLLVIGAVVVVAVYLYNWLQERSYHRRISQSFASPHDDVLLKAGVESAMTDGRLEPQIVPPDAGRGRANRKRSPRPRQHPESTPSLISSCEVDAAAPVPDAVIGEIASKTSTLGKPVTISGFDTAGRVVERGGAWRGRALYAAARGAATRQPLGLRSARRG